MSTDHNSKNPIPPVDHSGHRRRLRKRAAAEGIENFEPHNVLELLLFYTIPRADTNETGHRLLDRFGSVAAVLDAPAEELMQVSGVGPETAQFLNLLPKVFRIYMDGKSQPVKHLTDVDEIRDLLFPRFVGQDKEQLYMVCLQAGNAVGKCVLVAEGSVDSVTSDCRRIVLEALRNDAVGVVLAHNHPGGNTRASSADHIATARIANALNAVDVPLIEHFVFAQGRFNALSTDSRFTAYFGDSFRTTKKVAVPTDAEQEETKKTKIKKM